MEYLLQKNNNILKNSKVVKKALYVLVILLLIFTLSFLDFCVININVYAANLSERTNSKDTIESNASPNIETNKFLDAASALATGIISILAWLLRLITFVFFFAISVVFSLILDGNLFGTISVDKILFNEYQLTNADIFSSSSTAIEGLASNVSTWFRILFGVSLVIQLITLIASAIRAIIQSNMGISKNDVPHKILVKNFIKGIILTFAILIFCAATLKLNNVIVQALRSVTTITEDTSQLKIIKSIFSLNVTEGTVGLIIYIITQVLAFMLFVYYLRRLFKIAFLIVISPLVVSTYAIEESKGGAAKFQTWLKMFLHTVFIQVAHVIVFLSLVSVSYNMAREGKHFIQSIIMSTVALKFIWDAETIILSLFGLSAESAGNKAAATMGTLMALGRLGSSASKSIPRPQQVAVGGGKRPLEKTAEKRKFKNKNRESLGAGDRQNKKQKNTFSNKGKEKLDKAAREAENVNKPKTTAQRRKELLREKKKNSRPIFAEVKSNMSALKAATGRKIKGYAKSFPKAIFKRALGLHLAAVAAIASNASPNVSMMQAATMGYAVGRKGQDKMSEIAKRKKYDPRYKGTYDKTLDYESEQLDASLDRRAILTGEDPREERENDNRQKKPRPEKLIGEASEKTENKEENKKEKVEYQQDKLDNNDQGPMTESEEERNDEPIEIIIDESNSDGVTKYVDKITKVKMSDMEEAYKTQKKAAVEAVKKRENVSVIEANKIVENIEEAMYKNGNLRYSQLDPAVKNFLVTAIDKTVKEKINYFSVVGINKNKYNNEQKYNEAIKEAEERYKEDVVKRLKENRL